VHDELLISNIAAMWPGLPARRTEVGGVTVTCADIVRASEILILSRTSAIAPVLRAAGSPLAACDYFAAAAPYIEQARRAPKTGRAGAAGRHVTKNAFLDALRAALVSARTAETAEAMAAFAADERYATAMARDAVDARARAYDAAVRSALRAAVGRAVEACTAHPGLFRCAAATACGTGSCRFAAPPYLAVSAPAGPGRYVRPANHVRAGETFSEASAAVELTSPGPGRSIEVWDADTISAAA
jgi:hypothetical protein